MVSIIIIIDLRLTLSILYLGCKCQMDPQKDFKQGNYDLFNLFIVYINVDYREQMIRPLGGAYITANRSSNCAALARPIN